MDSGGSLSFEEIRIGDCLTLLGANFLVYLVVEKSEESLTLKRTLPSAGIVDLDRRTFNRYNFNLIINFFKW